MNKEGPPKKYSEPKRFQISVPQDTWDYLELLAYRGKIAWKPQDIAAHLVVREVTRLQRRKYHEQDFRRMLPPTSASTPSNLDSPGEQEPR